MLSTKSPSAVRAYNKLMGITAPEIAPPVRGAKKGPRQKEWTINMVFYTDQNIAEDDEQQDEEDVEIKKIARKKFKGYHQYWAGQLTVNGGTDNYWAKLQGRLIRQSNNKKEFNPLFQKCMTDHHFEEMMKTRLGYLAAFYAVSYTHLTLPTKRIV